MYSALEGTSYTLASCSGSAGRTLVPAVAVMLSDLRGALSISSKMSTSELSAELIPLLFVSNKTDKNQLTFLRQVRNLNCVRFSVLESRRGHILRWMLMLLLPLFSGCETRLPAHQQQSLLSLIRFMTV